MEHEIEQKDLEIQRDLIIALLECFINDLLEVILEENKKGEE